MTRLTRTDPGLWERMLAITDAQVEDAIGKWVTGPQMRDVPKRRDRMTAEVARLPTS